MRKMTIAFGAAAVLLPLQAFMAEQPSVFEEEIGSWHEFMEENAADEEGQQIDILFQTGAALFPMIGEDLSDKSRLEELRDERIGEFISVTVDGAIIALRDVPRTTWFAPYVRDIAEQGIVSGYRDENNQPTGLFGPQDNVTIEQMAKVMLYASGKTTQGCAGVPLNVTSSGSWSSSFISCVEKMKWLVYEDGSVDVHRNATRSEVISTLLQAFSVTPNPRTGTGFTDVTLTTLFGASIERAKSDGIVSGYTDDAGNPTNLFGPEDPVTRAEFAKIVTLGMQVYGD